MKSNWTTEHINPERVYTYQEAAKITRVSYGNITKWYKQGYIIYYNSTGLISGQNLIDIIKFRKWVGSADRQRETDTKTKSKHRRLHRDRQVARQTVTWAMAQGTLTRKPCVICKTTDKIEAHHEDYSKPLEITWLCRTHHRMVGKKAMTPAIGINRPKTVVTFDQYQEKQKAALLPG